MKNPKRITSKQASLMFSGVSHQMLIQVDKIQMYYCTDVQMESNRLKPEHLETLFLLVVLKLPVKNLKDYNEEIKLFEK